MMARKSQARNALPTLPRRSEGAERYKRELRTFVFSLVLRAHASRITSESTRLRDYSSLRLHPSSLQFTLPPLASNDLLGRDAIATRLLKYPLFDRRQLIHPECASNVPLFSCPPRAVVSI